MRIKERKKRTKTGAYKLTKVRKNDEYSMFASATELLVRFIYAQGGGSMFTFLNFESRFDYNEKDLFSFCWTVRLVLD